MFAEINLLNTVLPGLIASWPQVCRDKIHGLWQQLCLTPTQSVWCDSSTAWKCRTGAQKPFRHLLLVSTLQYQNHIALWFTACLSPMMEIFLKQNICYQWKDATQEICLFLNEKPKRKFCSCNLSHEGNLKDHHCDTLNSQSWRFLHYSSQWRIHASGQTSTFRFSIHVN